MPAIIPPCVFFLVHIHRAITGPHNKGPHKPDALSRFARPEAIKMIGVLPLLFFGLPGQVIGTFLRVAHQYGTRARYLPQPLDICFYLESGSLEL